MWSLVLLVILIVGGLVFAAAGLQGYGVFWAARVCSNARGLCEHSDAAALASASAAILYYVCVRRTA